MMKKNQQGITLIALVITIIVLLILAGVSIAMLTGENGILTKARKAGSDTKVATEKEQVILAINELTADYYDKKYVQNNTAVAEQTVGMYVATELANTEDSKFKGYATPASTGTGAAMEVTITTVSKNDDGKQVQAIYKAADGTLGEWTEVTPAP